MSMNSFNHEERKMLVENAARLLAQPAEYDRWSTFGEMGWLAMAMPQHMGGLQSDLFDICLLCEQMGRELAPEPYLACAVLPGACLSQAGAQMPNGWADELTTGAYQLSTSLFNLGQPVWPQIVLCVAQDAEKAWVLNGETGLVPQASRAKAMLVLAQRPNDGAGLFVVDFNAQGVTKEQCTLIDGSTAVRLRLESVRCTVPVLQCDAGQMQAMLAPVLRAGVLAHCAFTLGTMAKALEITQVYLNQRKQFGQAIASYQTIQHRLVDLFVDIEEARALSWQAALAQPDAHRNVGSHGNTTDTLCSAALALVSETAAHVWQEALQMHGAIGMTDEYLLGGYVKHLALASRCLGNHDQQLEHLANLCLASHYENKDEPIA